MATVPRFRIDVDIHTLAASESTSAAIAPTAPTSNLCRGWMQFSFQAPMALPNPSALTTHGLAQLELVQECFANGA